MNLFYNVSNAVVGFAVGFALYNIVVAAPIELVVLGVFIMVVILGWLIVKP